jgi:hypothetical protein
MLYSVESKSSDDFDFYHPRSLDGKYIISKKILTKAIHASLQIKRGVFIFKNENYNVSPQEILHCLSKHHVRNDNFIFIARSLKNKILEQNILVEFSS